MGVTLGRGTDPLLEMVIAQFRTELRAELMEEAEAVVDKVVGELEVSVRASLEHVPAEMAERLIIEVRDRRAK